MRLAGAVVIPVVIQQWFAARRLRIEHFAEEDRVVAGVDDHCKLAIEQCRRSTQQRHSIGTELPFDPMKAILLFGGKHCSDLLLAFGQNADSEMGASAKVVDESATMIDTDEDERGLNGNRRERTDCESVKRSILCANRRNRNTAGIVPAGIAEGSRV